MFTIPKKAAQNCVFSGFFDLTFYLKYGIIKAIMHDPCASDAQSEFSSDRLNFPQAYWRKSREIWVI